MGGNKARINDEKIPLKYGLIGQETTGVGGMFNALRVIPVMIEIAKDVESIVQMHGLLITQIQQV